MIKDDSRYNRYNLVIEMFEAVDYIKDFNRTDVKDLFSKFPENCPIMLTGEGSSRIFPAKNVIHHRLTHKNGPVIFTESSIELTDKNLESFVVIGASNSGKTKELINLFRELKNSGHPHLYGLSCNHNSFLEKYTEKTYVIDAGIEKAVAASKSVVAQAMFYDALLYHYYEVKEPDTNLLAGFFEQALKTVIDKSVTDKICKAEIVYFAGNNNGVAEELTLKTNEIVRKKSVYLPGTLLLHGIEEVVTSNDIIIMADPYPGEFDKIKSIYTDGIGTPVVAISDQPTPFLTVNIPSAPSLYESYIKLAAGWNLLVEAGIKLGIDLDKPERARKIGNLAAD